MLGPEIAQVLPQRGEERRARWQIEGGQPAVEGELDLHQLITSPARRRVSTAATSDRYSPEAQASSAAA